MELDPSDGLPIADVGEWAKEKHERLRRYVDISRAVRGKFRVTTYIDLYCGPGRARIRETGEIIDGSPVAAYLKARDGGAPFSTLYIADTERTCVEAARARLEAQHAPVVSLVGPAELTVDRIAEQLDPHGLHFTFIDPYGLELPFSIIKKLAQFKHMDMLIHVSVQDLTRNLRQYVARDPSPIDIFAPGWREAVNIDAPDKKVRCQILEYWLGLVRDLDMRPAEGIEVVANSRNRELYWLVLVARHKLAHQFWEKIRNITGQGTLDF